MALTNIIYLTKTQYNTLVEDGYITVSGVTYNYDTNADYRIPIDTPNYTELINKPKINGIELSGDKSLSDLNIQSGQNVAFTSTSAGKVIVSATDTQYTAGTNIAISNQNVVSTTNVYTKSEVDSAIQTAIGQISTLQFQVVETLPATGSAGIIYLVSQGSTTQNLYSEYIWVNNAFELLGSSSIDLSGKLDKITDNTNNYVYIHRVNGTEDKLIYTSDATADTIAYRDSNGRLSASDPSTSSNVTTKNYVDTQVATKQSVLTNGYNDLTNKPSINSVTLTGNKTTSDLNISYNDLTDQPEIIYYMASDGLDLDDDTFKVNIQDGEDVLTIDQGQLKIDQSNINTSELNNDAGFLTSHQDISGKLDKVTTSDNFERVYKINADGSQTTMRLIGGDYGICKYVTGQKLVCTTPTADNYAANKSYVDTADATKVSQVTTTSTNGQVYGVSSAGEQVTYAIDGANGVASKSYVDNQLATKQNTLTAGTGISINNNTISSTVAGLPSVTSSDNNKILQVVNGAWTAVTIANANDSTY